MLFIRSWTHSCRFAVGALTAAIAVATVAPLNAQAPNQAGANASKYGIAVVDISYIFKKHDRFNAQREAMKKEMETIEAELKADRETIAKQEQQRNQYNPGAPEYKQLDEQIARKMADFNLKMGKLRKEFLERESKVYYQTYLEVVDAITQYAQRQNIGLVLRFNGEPVDANNRDNVLREINKPIVVQDRVDITPDIIMMVNRSGPGAANAPQASGAPQGQPGGVPRTAQGTQFAPQGSQLPPR